MIDIEKVKNEHADLIERIVAGVATLVDRGHPKTMRVTPEELRHIVADAFEKRDEAPASPSTGAASFQARVQPWMMACFGPMISADVAERNHRLLEEVLELVQACGASATEAQRVVDYVYSRPVGEKTQEIGGVMVTLAALCLAHGLDMHAAGELELASIWNKVEAIRDKQTRKPRFGPSPEPSTA